MGEVKESVKGSGPSKKKGWGKKKKGATDGKNLIEHFRELRDEVSELTEIKDDDVEKEGDAEKAENMRKAAIRRACHSLLTSCQALLEDY